MKGAKFIFNARYFHIAKPGEELSDYALSGEHVKNLVEYAATRETVDYNIVEESDQWVVTQRQKEDIEKLSETFINKQKNLDFPEYETYKSAPTRKTASELISRLSKEIILDNSFDENDLNIANNAKKTVEYYNIKSRPATAKQIETIEELLKSINYSKEEDLPFEYIDYKLNPTIQNASELISRLSEELLIKGGFEEASNLIEYAAKRPGAYKVGEHGLFSSYKNVDLKKAMEEVSTHKGNIWTEILSLRREDADRLGYDSQEPWRNLIMSKIDKIAQAHNIPVNDLKWYGAMHNTGHHPHIHLFVFSANPSGNNFLSKGSIKTLKSEFVNQIFENERTDIYVDKDIYRKELIEKSRNILDELLKNPNSFFENQQLMEIANKMITLSERLPQTGRRKYGFLKAEEKNLVNDIQIKLIENNTKLNELYQNWCNEKYQLDKYYTTKVETIPIDKNDNFRVIKNEIIKHAYNIKEILDAKLSDNASSTPQHLSDEYSNGFYQSKNDFEILDTTAVPTYNEMPKSVYYDSDNKTTITGKFEKLYQQSVKLDTRTGESCRKLADCYNYGNGTEKNPAEAQMWYGIAADTYKDSLAAYRLGQMYLYGSNENEIDTELGNYYCKTAFHLFRDEIKNSEFFYNLENEDCSYLPYLTKVGQEDAYKEYLIGRMYLKGEGVEQNYFNSSKAFQLAAENGYAHANYYIGNQYYYGLGFEQDFEKAFSYYIKASTQGDKYATYRIGKMYLNGEGVKADLKQSEHCFSEASDSVLLANYDLAKLYEQNQTIFSNVSNEYIYSLYSTALKGLIEQEEDDVHDAFTEMRIANMYLNGEGTEVNIPEALKWLEKAAKLENPNAAYQLGYIYSSEKYNITDIEKANENYALALKGYEKAETENNNATAEYRIGMMYLNGLGVDKDIKKALTWLNKATLNGNDSAAYKLAVLYDEGVEITQDTEKARVYYTLSAELGNPYAEFKLGTLALEDADVQRAVEHFEKACEKNISHAWYKLGQIYSLEHLNMVDNDKAYYCYSKALEQYINDYTKAPDNFTAYRIGNMYLHGQGTEINISQAVTWFTKSAELNNPDAAYQLGYIYSSEKYNITDIEKANENYALALKGYEKAETENSNATAEYRIGMIYLNGLGVDKDIKKALSWLNKATLNGNDSAAYKLAVLYDEGVEITQDTEKARVYYTLSAELGNPYAEFKLGNLAFEDADVQKAVEHFEKACEKNISHAWYKLGQIYSLEHLNMVDNDKAYYCYSKALEQYINDYTKAPDNFTAYRIGNMYLHGQGTEINISQAVTWFTKSAELNNPDAAYQLGYIYKNDTYGIKDDTLSNKYFSSALSSYLSDFEKNPTDGNLAMRIGTFYHYGLGVERDMNRAISWYKTAVELGNQNAQQKINEATQQQEISLMGIASVACHIGKILNTETTAAFKQKYSSDTKILRKEKMQKIESGHAVSDKPFDYDY